LTLNPAPPPALDDSLTAFSHPPIPLESIGSNPPENEASLVNSPTISGVRDRIKAEDGKRDGAEEVEVKEERRAVREDKSSSATSQTKTKKPISCYSRSRVKG